jgi:hypothetical protein
MASRLLVFVVGDQVKTAGSGIGTVGSLDGYGESCEGGKWVSRG